MSALPPWKAMIDLLSGRRFYQNVETNEWFWDQPQGPAGRGSNAVAQTPSPNATSPVSPRIARPVPSGYGRGISESYASTGSNDASNYSLGYGASTQSVNTGTPQSGLVAGLSHLELARQAHESGSNRASGYHTQTMSGSAPDTSHHPPIQSQPRPSAAARPLDIGFKVRHKPNKFFTAGKVFIALHTEPASQNSRLSEYITPVAHGQKVYSSIRRFVVLRPGNGSSVCLQILTYGGQGLGKSGAQKSDHAVIYTGQRPPESRADENPKRGEEGMQPYAFQVIPSGPDRLDPLSRINLAKLYTVEHTWQVKPVGVIAKFEVLWAAERAMWERHSPVSTPVSRSLAPPENVPSRGPNPTASGSMPVPIPIRPTRSTSSVSGSGAPTAIGHGRSSRSAGLPPIAASPHGNSPAFTSSYKQSGKMPTPRNGSSPQESRKYTKDSSDESSNEDSDEE